jgi:tetratricopeptide (TPR) repeat protein
MLLFANRSVMKTSHTSKLTGFAFLLVSLSAGYGSAFATRINQEGREGIASASRLREVERLEEAGELAAAIEACRKILERDSENEKVELILAESYRRVHNEEEARAVLRRGRKQHPRNVAVLTASGNLELDAQAFDAAIEAFQAALKLEPMNTIVRNQLAGTYLRKGDASLALQELNVVLTREPANGLALFLRAGAYADADKNDQALADIKKVMAQRPEYLPARMLAAKILVRTNDCDGAVAILRPPKRPPELDADGLFLLANAYDCVGKKELADGVRTQFEAASRAEHEQTENRVQSLHLVEQANELAMRNNFTEAMESLRQALEKNPQNAFAYSQQAKIYFSMKEAGKAREALAKARQIQPYQPDFLFVQGVIEAADGNLDAAQRSFEDVTSVNPKEADAYFEIGKICVRRNDRKCALDAFRKAAELSPDDPDYRQAVQELSGLTQ